MVSTHADSKSGTTAGAAAVEINADMTPNRQYKLRAKGALWFRVVAKGASGGAVAAIAGDGSHYLGDGQFAEVAAYSNKTRVSIIRDGASDVTGCLSEVANLANVPAIPT